MDVKNKRKEKRIKVELLPNSMKQYIIHLNPENEIIANIVDASMSGLGIIAPVDFTNFIVGSSIAIYPIGKDFALYGKIAHVSSINALNTRVGIALRETRALEKYQSILKNLEIQN